MNLPVLEKKEEILAAIAQGNRLVLEAPTGSGKSTAVPQLLLESAIQGKILVVQPRQLATKMLARRVASLLNCAVGAEVGYQVRFDRKESVRTRILFLTQGILVRMLLSGDNLAGVGAVLLDEFHERSLDSDLGLALLKRLQSERPELKLIVMSATLDGESIQTYLGNCSRVKAEGRLFPVDKVYSSGDRETKIWDKVPAALKRYSDIIPEDGSILVFMPGVFEIRKTISALEATGWGRSYDLYALYGALSPELQDKAVASDGRRKIIVSTNVAETSLTIEGVRIVVDSGLAKVASYDSGRGMNTLLTERISRASSEQRAGRAGRMSAGVCLRLWSEREQEYLMPYSQPEIRRLELSEAVLTLKVLGVRDCLGFDWFDSPDEKAVARAEELLKQLGAIDEHGVVSALGKWMSSFPLHPRLSKMVSLTKTQSGRERVAFFCAMMQERDFILPLKDKKAEEFREDMGMGSESDLIGRYHIWNQMRQKSFDPGLCKQYGIHRNTCIQLDNIVQQILLLSGGLGNDVKSDECIEEEFSVCLASSFSDHLAIRQSKGTLRYVLSDGRSGELRRNSFARKADMIICCEMTVMDRSQGVGIMLSMANPVTQELLKLVFPDEWKDRDQVYYSEKDKRVIATRQTCFREWVISESETSDVSDEIASEILAKMVMDGLLTISGMDESVERFCARLYFVSEHFPEMGLKPISEKDRFDILQMAFAGMRSYKEIKKLPVLEYFQSWIDPAVLGMLDHYAPESIILPSRSKPFQVHYNKGEASISAKVQELYDVPSSKFQIADGKVGLRIEILAPNFRPVQVTQSIDSFWTTSYPQIKKDLKGRYPKHEWR